MFSWVAITKTCWAFISNDSISLSTSSKRVIPPVVGASALSTSGQSSCKTKNSRIFFGNVGRRCKFFQDTCNSSYSVRCPKRLGAISMLPVCHINDDVNLCQISKLGLFDIFPRSKTKQAMEELKKKITIFRQACNPFVQQLYYDRVILNLSIGLLSNKWWCSS